MWAIARALIVDVVRADKPIATLLEARNSQEARMDDVMLQQLWWHAVAMALIWVPFAIGAAFVDGWNTENGRVWRTKLAHPGRTAHDWRLARVH
jgi:hypothetical protein